MNVIDILCIVFVLIGFILGLKKGFFGSITKPIRIIAAVCLTVLVATPVLDHFTRDFFVGKVGDWIYGAIPEAGTASVESLPTLIKFSIDLFDISTEGLTTAEDMVGALARPVGGFIAILVTYLVLFIVLMLLLKILIALLDIPFHKGLLGKLNKILGLLLGGVVAAVVACIFVNIVGSFSADLVKNAISQFFMGFNPFKLVLSF